MERDGGYNIEVHGAHSVEENPLDYLDNDSFKALEEGEIKKKNDRGNTSLDRSDPPSDGEE